MANAPGKLGGRVLTNELRKLASQVISVDDEGNPITREQTLSKLIWDQALGFTEKKRTDEGHQIEVYHPPVSWAQQYLFERMEGKAPQAIPDERQGIKASDQVSQLAKDRLNKMAAAVMKPAGPPKYTPPSKG